VDMNDSEIIFSVHDSPEGGFEARALGHAIFTQAETMEELKTMVRDADATSTIILHHPSFAFTSSRTRSFLFEAAP
jgi:hypothetical protein